MANKIENIKIWNGFVERLILFIVVSLKIAHGSKLGFSVLKMRE